MNESTHLPTSSRFYGAAVVEDDGRETPITEEMILSACRELERSLKTMGQGHQMD